MILVRPSQERGHARYDWLDTKHTFSFSTYRDTRWMGFYSLVVINEDRIAPQTGFGMHHHDNMEILTYVISGELEHKDSLGNGSIIRAGDVQYMSAGTGVDHSEHNPSRREPVHLLQMWLLPDRDGHPPTYDQKHFTRDQRHNTLCALASYENDRGSIQMRSHAHVYGGIFDAGMTYLHELNSGRVGWIQVISGSITLNEMQLSVGDGAGIRDVIELHLRATSDCEFLLYDIAK